MGIKHIIWDWNGTLLDDCWLSVAAMNRLLKRRNLPLLTPERYREIFTFPVIDYYRRLGFDFEREPFTVSGTEFIREYTRRALEPELHRAVVTVLEKLQRSGVTQSILSASKQHYLERQIQHHQLGAYFIRIVGQDDHYAHGKTVAGRAWMAELHYGPHEVLFVGDTLHDREVAEAIGADCVLLAHGHTSLRRLLATGVPVFRDLNEFYSWFRRERKVLPVSRGPAESER
jgi:phosphoglycolate phosphatase